MCCNPAAVFKEDTPKNDFIWTCDLSLRGTGCVEGSLMFKLSENEETLLWFRLLKVKGAINHRWQTVVFGAISKRLIMPYVFFKMGGLAGQSAALGFMIISTSTSPTKCLQIRLSKPSHCCVFGWFDWWFNKSHVRWRYHVSLFNIEGNVCNAIIAAHSKLER